MEENRSGVAEFAALLAAPPETVGCSDCPAVTEPGDVEMCVHCWQWWTCVGAISTRSAGALAGAKMDNDECLAALDRAAYLMEMDR